MCSLNRWMWWSTRCGPLRKNLSKMPCQSGWMSRFGGPMWPVEVKLRSHLRKYRLSRHLWYLWRSRQLTIFLNLNSLKIFRRNSVYFWLPCKFTAALISYHFPLYMCEFGLLFALFSVLFFNDEKTLNPIKILLAKKFNLLNFFNSQGSIKNFDFIYDLNPNEQEKKS